MRPIGIEFRSFFAYVWKGFREDRCVFSAGQLSYTTLLAIVPLLAVCFSMLAAFPVFDSVREQIQSFILQNFVPAVGAVVQEHLQGFIDKASKLTAPGIGFLILTALMLMTSADRILNQIFKVRTRRSRVHGFLVYWAVLTLGPLLMGISIALSSYLVSLPLIAEATGETVRRPLLALLPFLAATGAFALLFALVPNRKVPLRCALAGGVVAALLFEGAKKGFALYVTNFPTYEAIYGALASVPIFLVWLYVTWLVILFGAEFKFALMSYRRAKGNKGEGNFIRVFRVLGHFHAAHQRGESIDQNELLRREPEELAMHLWPVVADLEKAGLLRQMREGEWILAKDLNGVTLWDLYRVCPYKLPDVSQGMARDIDWNQRLAEVLQEPQQYLQKGLSISLPELYSESSSRTGAPNENNGKRAIGP